MNQVGAVATEKYFSVVVELDNGEKRALPVRGETSGQVFHQIKQQPEVRRVGKVTEISRSAFDAIVEGREPAPEPGRDQPNRNPPERSDKWIGHVIAGPRVISHARPSGGEQPFKHLQAPPERPKPRKRVPEPSPQPPARAPSAEPITAFRPPAAPPAADPVAPTPSPAVEYRILKSRRQGGPPYFLQRGAWQQLKGKRAFIVEWEKDFNTREEAETFRNEQGDGGVVG